MLQNAPVGLGGCSEHAGLWWMLSSVTRQGIPLAEEDFKAVRAEWSQEVWPTEPDWRASIPD